MKDKDIIKRFKIPKSTFYDWKKRSDYRRLLIEYLRTIK